MNRFFNKKYKLLAIGLILSVTSLHFVALSNCNMTDEHSCAMDTTCEMEKPMVENENSCCSSDVNDNLPAQETFVKNLNECNCFHVLESNAELIITKTENNISPLKLIGSVLTETQTKICKSIFYFDNKSNSIPQSIPIYLSSNSFLI